MDHTQLVVEVASDVNALVDRLQRTSERQLRFAAAGTSWIPYYEVDGEHFSCVPMIKAGGTLL